ncbi:RING-H2 finger protein ATL5-like [Lucilia cuprina]|uniref:RING-H2 finger protein ATL5-like n=1 Tax=Lucilia cuprina TaxID=7375 RepID=UPI001F068024|nr:RING-H2 finger protein ATL5-like [Lucilia cuprina]
MATDPTSSQGGIAPPLPSAPVVIEPSVCQICMKTMEEGQECLILNLCSHVFHGLCIETHLATSSECPTCKRNCQLSELRKLVIQPKGTLARSTGTKPRGALARHYQTRSVSRNLTQDNVESNPNAYNVDEPVRAPETNTPNVSIENVITQNDNQASVSNNGIDYQEINRLIEQNLTRLLSNMNFVPNTNPELP